MREYDFNSYSVGDALLFEMHEELKNRKLLENNENFIKYNEFINSEKIHTIPHNTLVIDKIYFPIGFQAVPAGELIIAKYADSDAKYTDTHHGKLYFNLNNRIIDFPRTLNTGNGLLETLVYASASEQQHFITLLNMKFGHWTIKINKIGG